MTARVWRKTCAIGIRWNFDHKCRLSKIKCGQGLAIMTILPIQYAFR